MGSMNRTIQFLCTCILTTAIAFVPIRSAAHGGDNHASDEVNSRRKPLKPNHKSEEAALEELSFFIRDIEKRMRMGDVVGVHDRSAQITATADNLWTLGLKKEKGRNRPTINGYMNLLKSAARGLEAYGGKEDLEFGGQQLSEVRRALALLRDQYFPGRVWEAQIPGSRADSVSGNAIPAKVDTGRSDPGVPNVGH